MKTLEQEKLEGCPGRRPLNTSAPVPAKKIPAPPKWMGRISTRAYHDLTKLVGPEGMNVMANTDKLAMVMLCEAFEEWRECRKILESDGRYYKAGKDDNTLIKRHPAVGDMQNAWGRVMAALGKFGMTPYDRKNVSVLVSEEKEETREDRMANRRADAAKKAKEAANGKNHLKAVNS